MFNYPHQFSFCFVSVSINFWSRYPQEMDGTQPGCWSSGEWHQAFRMEGFFVRRGGRCLSVCLSVAWQAGAPYFIPNSEQPVRAQATTQMTTNPTRHHQPSLNQIKTERELAKSSFRNRHRTDHRNPPSFTFL